MKPGSFLARLLRRLNKTATSFFFLDQWTILTAKGPEYDSLQWPAFRSIVPPRDRYWADPFIVVRNDQDYIFIEEKIYATGRGRIACLTLGGDGTLQSHQVVLERPYHLSYPFIFDYRGETYMLPETAQNRTLEVYRCVRFPDRWEAAKTLMTDIYAVDATLLEYENRWWLFANLKEEGGSSLDALHLFFSDDPLSDRWTPHPQNPIVRDVRSARPAGRIFRRAGKWIRPSQDASRRYGYAIKFNRIVRLSETDYEETSESSFEPPPRTEILATHTFNRVDKRTVIDAVIRRWKFSSR
ncbi:MAG TPA: hypothetical protein VLZ89_02145 [Anaerolineales bacterium]|nr:hypothetical protein [Anaerolineales bacterium]